MPPAQQCVKAINASVRSCCHLRSRHQPPPREHRRPEDHVTACGLLAALAYLPLPAGFGPARGSAFGPFAVQASRLLPCAVCFAAGVAAGRYELAFVWPALYGCALILSCAAATFALLAAFPRFGRRSTEWDSMSANVYGIHILHCPPGCNAPCRGCGWERSSRRRSCSWRRCWPARLVRRRCRTSQTRPRGRPHSRSACQPSGRPAASRARRPRCMHPRKHAAGAESRPEPGVLHGPGFS